MKTIQHKFQDNEETRKRHEDEEIASIILARDPSGKTEGTFDFEKYHKNRKLGRERDTTKNTDEE